MGKQIKNKTTHSQIQESKMQSNTFESVNNFYSKEMNQDDKRRLLMRPSTQMDNQYEELEMADNKDFNNEIIDFDDNRNDNSPLKKIDADEIEGGHNRGKHFTNAKNGMIFVL